MILKVMITGSRRNIVSEVTEGIERDTPCSTFNCPVIKARLYEMIMAERPRVVIICAGNETPEEVKYYDVFKEYSKLNPLTVIVIANEEDTRSFTRYTTLRRLLLLPRPVVLPALYSKLNEIIDMAQRETEQSAFTEFINDDPSEEYSRKHILVVDDDPQQLMQIKDHLKSFYEVTVLNSGKQVIKCLNKFRIDLIFLDYRMPDLGGPDVLIEIRKHPQFHDIPVVFLTGMSDKETVTKIIVDLKPRGYLLKPTTKSEIVKKVIDILG